MAEYTRDIQQLQKTASQQPSFAPPSPSLAGDLVNLIGTGLDFYAKDKAQDSLDAIAKGQAEKDKTFASGVLGFRDLRQALEGQPNITPTKRLQMENDYIRKYGPEVGSNIIKATNTMTGDNFNKASARIAATQKAAQQQQEAVNLEASAYASQVLGMDASTVAGLDITEMEVLANESKLLGRQIEIQKQIMEVSDDITAPIIEIQRNLSLRKMNTQLDGIREANRRGDTNEAIALGTEFRNSILESTTAAPRAIKEMMAQAGKANFYNANLVTAYTQELAGMLNDPTIKNVLSGKEIDEETTNSVVNKLNYYMSESFFKNIQAVQDGDIAAGSMDDLKNTTEYFTGKGLSPTSLTKTTEKTLKRALNIGGAVPPPDPNSSNSSPALTQKESVDTSSRFIDVTFAMINKATQVYKSLGKEEIREVNEMTKGYMLDKLDKDKGLSENDMQWIEDSLTFGNTGNTDKRGKGASKAVLQAPLQILAHPNYQEKVKPAVDKAIANGIDPISALTTSLDNHIKNNFNNAYTALVGVATSGMPLSPMTSLSKGSRGQRGTYNLRDKIELHNNKGDLRFKYKAGTLGQSTDAVMILNLRDLNGSLVVLNDYVKAMSNVTETEGVLVADEIRGLLGRYVNIPLPEDSQ